MPSRSLMFPFMSAIIVALTAIYVVPDYLLNFTPFPEAQAILPKPTTLTLNPIGNVLTCHTVTVTGKLAYTSTGAGIQAESITFSSDNNGGIPHL
jgi:hypothetical protein